MPIDGSCITNQEACGAAAYCDQTGAPTCKARVELGDPCPGYGCVAGAYCDDSSGSCELLKDEGEDCSAYYECKSQNCDVATSMCSPAAMCTLPE